MQVILPFWDSNNIGPYSFGLSLTIRSANSPLSSMITSLSRSVWRIAPGIPKVTTCLFSYTLIAAVIITVSIVTVREVAISFGIFPWYLLLFIHDWLLTQLSFFCVKKTIDSVFLYEFIGTQRLTDLHVLHLSQIFCYSWPACLAKELNPFLMLCCCAKITPKMCITIWSSTSTTSVHSPLGSQL